MDQAQIREIQAQFLRKIEDVLPKNTTLVNELADLLRISSDSAYRRMRGETLLVLDEILLLSEYFKVSFDTYTHKQEGWVAFRYLKLNPARESFKTYLMAMLRDLKIIADAPQRVITYACEDIPVFHHYRHPLMAQFKMFYWMHAIMGVPELESEKFVADRIDEELSSVGLQIIEQYSAVPSIEIWTETTIQSTVKQIAFFWESGKFRDKDDALAVCNSLREVITAIQKQAEQSAKWQAVGTKGDSDGNNYQLYYSEIEITNNCVLVDMGTVSSVYLGHFSFSTMSTTSESYCAETRKWFEVIRRKSVLISGVSEKQRYQVFKKYFSQINELEQSIQNS
jgi:hypothetical protein